jgi:tetratricopeptide (TPR) repeat protein
MPQLSDPPAPTPQAASDEAARVFVSYSRKDLGFVDRLDASLRARGIETLIDRAAIEVGENWFARLRDLIARAETVLFVLSPDSVQSPICREEVAFARKLGKRFIPVVARRVEDPSVPEALAELNYVFLDDEGLYEKNVDRLVAAIRTDLAWMRRHADLGRAAEEWNAAGRPRGLLLGTGRLREAEQWIAARPANAPPPSDDTRDLIAASRRAARLWRNGLVGALAAGLVVATGLAGIAYSQRQVAERQTELATARQAEAARERDRATQALADAKQAANGLIFDIAQRLRGRGLPVTLVRDVLGQAETLMARLVDSAPGDVLLARTQGAMYVEFADTYANAGDTERQRAAAERALAIYRRLAAADPASENAQHDLELGLERLGNAQAATGDFAGALASYEQSATIARRFAERYPTNPRAQRELAVSLGKIGDLRMALGDPGRALAGYEEARVIVGRLAEAAPADAVAARDHSAALSRVGYAKWRSGDLDGALESYRLSLAISRRLADQDPADAGAARDLSFSLSAVGDIQASHDRLDDAFASYGEALAIRRRLVAQDPSSASAARNLATSLASVGHIHLGRRDLAEALALYGESLVICRRLAEQDPASVTAAADLAVAFHLVGDAELERGAVDEAEARYRDSLAIRRRLAGGNPSSAEAALRLAAVLRRLASLEAKRGNIPAACAWVDEGHAALRPFGGRAGMAQVLTVDFAWFEGRKDACRNAGTGR